MSKTLVKSWDIFVVCVKMVNCMVCTSTVLVIVFFQASIAVVCPHLPWVLFESLPLPSYFEFDLVNLWGLQYRISLHLWGMIFLFRGVQYFGQSDSGKIFQMSICHLSACDHKFFEQIHVGRHIQVQVSQWTLRLINSLTCKVGPGSSYKWGYNFYK